MVRYVRNRTFFIRKLQFTKFYLLIHFLCLAIFVGSLL